MAADLVPDETGQVLATARPTAGQRRLALSIVAVLFAIFTASVAIGLTAPFAPKQVRVSGFVTILAATLFINDLITATLLYGQFSIIRSRSLLVIASAYLFTGPMAIVFALTFPGEFSPTGLLGAGLQTSAWLYNFWHYGFPVAVILYAMLIGIDTAKKLPRSSVRFAVSASVMVVICLIAGLTWLATAGEDLLPPLFLDPTHPTPLARTVTSANTFICLLALVLLYVRRRSVLDLWLVVVMCAWISELAILDVLLYARFTFGFYVGRGFSLITSVVVLVVLLYEMTELHARLARSNSALQRERTNKMMSLEAMAASIAHEVNQPLSALVTNGGVGLRLLARSGDNVDELRQVLKLIIDDGHRASNIISSVRAMFGRKGREKSLVSVDDLVRQVVAIARAELDSHHVSLQIELRPSLPLVSADRVQLQQVLLNLIANAVEAMGSGEIRKRSLLVKCEMHGASDVLVTVEDSGPGIDPDNMDRIFDAFYTTKSHGMGLGLSISRSIVESHGGRLWASARNPHGAVFHIQLPGDKSVSR